MNQLSLHAVLLFIILRCGDFVVGQDKEILNFLSLSDEEIYLWNSTNFPNAYPFQNKTLNITSEETYFINVKITNLNINTDENGDKLIITSSDSTQIEEITNSTTDYDYNITCSGAVIKFLVYDENTKGSNGFNMTIQRFLNGTKNETVVEDKITVSITGKNALEYNNSATIMSLKNVIAKMATEFCSHKSFVLNNSITADNVTITYLNTCPSNWAEASTCVTLTFAVPIALADDYFGYQLNSTSLQEMWDKLAQRYLNTIGLGIYVGKDGSKYLTTWILIFSIVLVVFMVAMYLVRCLIKRSVYRSSGKRNISDMDTIWKERDSVNEFHLGPHPLQDVPPFFQSQIQDFEPGITEAEPTPMYSSDSRLGNIKV
ncbi:uncharacterized protein LOC112905504 isoform X2 [Agrilus planipennis]|uniref:Uncharacterized protein LOC112905504 isoform X2 n=1 Tax=Agrilus planipennis TaxID=224129 RepID=A0A7F5RD07_AGRPL|nr:uncharacterized protein LOC112905504 isoform X2 [Agrilus planipennis]